MQTKNRFLLLLLVAVCILSVYSCRNAIPTALATEHRQDDTYYTYRYPMKHITDLSVSVTNADFYFYTEAKSNELVIQVKGAALEEAVTEKRIKLKSTEKEAGQIYICLPARFYNITVTGERINVNTAPVMRGTMHIGANCLYAQLDGYCGSLWLSAEQGSVQIKNGTLKSNSAISLHQKGNIYLDTKFTDTKEIASFSTGQGIIKVQTDRLSQNTLFEVTALSVFGSYAPLDTAAKKKNTDYKAELLSPNGIVSFEE